MKESEIAIRIRGDALMSVLFISVGLGCLWHGLQIVWVAPTPSQFKKEKIDVQRGSPQAFQIFWLDQYAWIGIVLSVVGVVLLGWGIL